eukprot:gene12302-biopygen12878
MAVCLPPPLCAQNLDPEDGIQPEDQVWLAMRAYGTSSAAAAVVQWRIDPALALATQLHLDLQCWHGADQQTADDVSGMSMLDFDSTPLIPVAWALGDEVQAVFEGEWFDCVVAEVQGKGDQTRYAVDWVNEDAHTADLESHHIRARPFVVVEPAADEDTSDEAARQGLPDLPDYDQADKAFKL